MRKRVMLILSLSVLSVTALAAENSIPAESQTIQSSLQESRWEKWRLSENELETLSSILPIENAFTDASKLTPYELLGKYASTEFERKQYAEHYVNAMLAHQTRSLEWAVAVADVLVNANHGKALLQSKSISGYLHSQRYKGYVGTEGYSRAQLLDAVAPGRWHVFVLAEKCRACDAAFDRALDALRNHKLAGIDVVFVGMPTGDQVRATRWARRQGITADMIAADKVTLNYENAEWENERDGRAAPLIIDSSTGDPIE